MIPRIGRRAIEGRAEIAARLHDAVTAQKEAMDRLRFKTSPTQAETGQLWTLKPAKILRSDAGAATSAPRFVIIVRVPDMQGEGRKSVLVALVSVETEFASFYDLIVPMERSPIGCSFMVECWNLGLTRLNSLGKAMAKLAERTVRDIRALSRTHKSHLAGKQSIASGIFVGAADEECKRFQARERNAVRDLHLGLR